MRSVGMTVLTREIALHSRCGKAAAGDHVISGFVARLAFKIHSLFIRSHVNVTNAARLLQVGVHVTVFNRIAAASHKMAIGAAGGPAGSADILGNLYEIHFLIREPRFRRRFFIGFGGVVANKAIDLRHIRKIEAVILPSVTDMATGAPLPIAVYIDAKIVDGVMLFPQIRPFFMADGIG